MKKEYTKPLLDTKAYAQFENVFTACNKGNASPQGCIPNVTPHPGDGFQYADFGSHGST